MSRKTQAVDDSDRREELAHDFMTNVLHLCGPVGPFFFKQAGDGYTLHCHLQADIDTEIPIAPQIEAAMRGFTRSIDDAGREFKRSEGLIDELRRHPRG